MLDLLPVDTLPELLSLSSTLLHELFESTVDRQPRRIAVECGSLQITYAELERRANRIAHWLRSLGAEREGAVAIMLPRGERFYETMLGVLKAGCAYLPLDPQIPPERLAFILDDCQAHCLLTLSGVVSDEEIGVPVYLLDQLSEVLAAQPECRIPWVDSALTPNNLAYVIYTSGTTGRPKGVQLEHRNVVSLVLAESELYGIRDSDRILQLASVAFDASVEEIWMAFYHGATLVPATLDILLSGADFSAIAAGLKISVLSCVPSFLSMLEDDISTLRLLVMGGEVCPRDLAMRWLRPGRQVFNTYGPTETTVIATACLLHANRPVTLGRPINSYKIFLLDSELNLLPPDVAGIGEMCIAGPGVARGYLGRPELTAEKFITTDKITGSRLRLYRSGDLARWTPGGELEFLGRADSQVKLRGFRVELAEVEAALLECPGILGAAVIKLDTQQLAAYIVCRSNGGPDRSALRQQLAARLSSYMVPAFLEELKALPLTIAGKLDRSQLPAAHTPLHETRRLVEPADSLEAAVLDACQTALGQTEISMEDDFFADLGGHSLLAAQLISRLRRHASFAGLSVGDVYAHPTLRSLAARARPQDEDCERAQAEHSKSSMSNYLLCALGQAAGIIFVAGLYAWQWLGAYLAYGYLVVEDWPVAHALLGALAIYTVTTPAVLALSVALKWLLVGRMRPGAYPLWGWAYYRFWLMRAVVRASPVHYLAGTPFLNLYYRLMGANIGKGVFLGSHGLTTFDNFTIGDGSSLGYNTSCDGSTVEKGVLRIAPVSVGKGCWVGHRSFLGSDSVMEDGAGLDDLSALPDGSRIPAGQLWSGSPATCVGELPRADRGDTGWSFTTALLQLAGIFFFPLLVLAAVFPGLMAIFEWGHQDEGYNYLMTAPLVGVSFVVFLCLLVWGLKWLLLGRLKPGRYPLNSFMYVRLWFFDKLMGLSLEVLGTLYTTLYVRPWLQAMGAKLGPRSEISTIRFVHPDLLETGDECFLADDVSVGAPLVRAGWLTYAHTRLGDRTFIGNGAFLPAGSDLGANSLVGSYSRAPKTCDDGTSWFGSPAFKMNTRKLQSGFADAATYQPSRQQVALRLVIEFFRILLPSTIFVVLASLIISATDYLQDLISLGEWLLVLPWLYTAAGALAILTTVLLKWAVVGRYRCERKPLWSSYVRRSELVTGVYENLGVLFFIDLLRGTPYITWVLRALGMKVGKRCYIDTTWFTEFDLIELGDEVALNDNANLQTHLFEDRVMTTGRVAIGARCSVGSMSTVLPNAHVEDDCSLGDLSLVMRGESLPAHTDWRGIPARRIG